MSCGKCTGACCAVFEFRDPQLPGWEDVGDGEFIADMLIPLDLVTAAERMERFGAAYWADQVHHDWEGRSIKSPSRRLYTCRHWDEDTKLCGAYESRPTMCAEYPYYADDCDYKCGYKLTFQQMWDRALRLHGAERGTPSNIVRSNN